MPEITLVSQLVEDAYTAAYQVTSECKDNPPDEWIRAYIAACAKLLGGIPGIAEIKVQR